VLVVEYRPLPEHHLRKPDNPAHWSKDYVEHLRIVHFALIAISAGLVVLLLTSKEYNAVNALVQLEEIINFKQQWNKEWLRAHGSFNDQKFENRTTESGDFILSADVPFISVDVNGRAEIVECQIEQDWFSVPLNSPGTFAFDRVYSFEKQKFPTTLCRAPH
jgi:hypothetical protein